MKSWNPVPYVKCNERQGTVQTPSFSVGAPEVEKVSIGMGTKNVIFPKVTQEKMKNMVDGDFCHLFLIMSIWEFFQPMVMSHLFSHYFVRQSSF